jgi:hypothetical protein
VAGVLWPLITCFIIHLPNPKQFLPSGKRIRRW